MIFDFAFAQEILPRLAWAALTTVGVTLVAFIFALIIGVPLVLLGRVRSKVVAQTTKVVSNFIRSTPLLIQLFFLYFGLPQFGIELAPLTTGLVVFSVHFGCYMSEVYRAGLESVPRGQWDAVQALSLSRLDAYRLVILPQAIRPVIPAAGNYLVHMFKETPLLASISVVEMLFVSSEIGAEKFRYTEPLTLCGLLFLAMSVSAGVLIKMTERFYNRAFL